MSYLVATDLARSYMVGRKTLFRRPRRFFAVDGVSLSIEKGETLGIVESPAVASPRCRGCCLV